MALENGGNQKRSVRSNNDLHSAFETRVRAATRARSRGQGIIEGVAMLMVVVPIAILLLFLIVNVGFVLMNQQKINMVAAETAKIVSGRRYYLGAEVPTFRAQRPAIEANAQLICNAMLTQLNLPTGTATFSYSDVEGTTSSIVGCNINVTGIKVFSDGLVFPSIVTLNGQGVAAQDTGVGTGNSGQHMIARLAVRNEDGSQRWVLYLPLYNAEKENVGLGSGCLAAPSWPAHYTQVIMATQGVDIYGPNGFRQVSSDHGKQYGAGGF